MVELSAITEFVFVKEGAQGTNGTEAVCWLEHNGKIKGNFIEAPYKNYFDYNMGLNGNQNPVSLNSNVPFSEQKIQFLKRQIKDNEGSVIAENINCFKLTPDFALAFQTKDVYYDEKGNLKAFPFDSDYIKKFANILQGKCIIDGKECSNILPIVTTFYAPIKTDDSTNISFVNDYIFIISKSDL